MIYSWTDYFLTNSNKYFSYFDGLVWFIVLNATFNNILVISWRSVLLVEETVVPGEIHRPVTSHWQTWSHNVVSILLTRTSLQTINKVLCRRWSYESIFWLTWGKVDLIGLEFCPATGTLNKLLRYSLETA